MVKNIFDKYVGLSTEGAPKKYKVCVFGASSMMFDPKHAEDSAYVGHAIGQAGYLFIYGGGSAGQMGIASKAALEAGGEIRGYRMDCFAESTPYPQQDYEVICKTISERKERMLLDADAYIGLAPGFGTGDEVFEAGLEQYLGGYFEPPVHRKPIILINRNGMYDPFMDWMDKMIEQGSAKPAVKEFFTLTKDGRDAIAALERIKNAPPKPAVAVGNVGQEPNVK